MPQNALYPMMSSEEPNPFGLSMTSMDLERETLKLADLRVRYSRAELTEDEVLADPLDQFQKWLKEALDAQLPEPNAMTLSTVDAQGQPSGRVVLLKSLREGQFVFFTNYSSRKARELRQNPRVGLTWHWHELERQVNLTGRVEAISREETAEYFYSRPRESQIGAWASHQSELVTRQEIHQRYEELSTRWEGQAIPLPEFWGGYAVTANAIEFWQGRPSRLHDRILYQRDSAADSWRISRLSP